MIMNMEILEDFSGSNVEQMITKGKRTKRPRPSSSASSSGGARGGGEFCNSSFISSPTTSSAISTCTEEDEDMAKCLILLSHGGSPPPHTAAEEEDKFTTRKFTEMATTTIGKVGIYVYECKTCNRTFPSFQALGGHRASHKKPKTTVDIDRKKSPPPPPLAEPVTPPPSSHIDRNKPKIHECSICGSEFGSGQALGGHMRRHRSAPPNETTPSVGDHQKARNMLVLDLNLPAPPEDEKYNQFSSKQQPPNLVFSAAALVDCHY
ncbi:hypothetical protein BUALT_Bualt13G0068400 [Buddleja alternifolia]|uniref:C2H2-type domain-containing protein n=1 Tax=Buddleja alternifolia TaxID=168488 RepID=A0AAV6WM37_9LAMI|nr:hypothetical protein BUALT_Bualt13G0068400 [Buddleja alternifolia]